MKNKIIALFTLLVFSAFQAKSSCQNEFFELAPGLCVETDSQGRVRLVNDTGKSTPHSVLIYRFDTFDEIYGRSILNERLSDVKNNFYNALISNGKNFIHEIAFPAEPSVYLSTNTITNILPDGYYTIVIARGRKYSIDSSLLASNWPDPCGNWINEFYFFLEDIDETSNEVSVLEFALTSAATALDWTARLLQIQLLFSAATGGDTYGLNDALLSAAATTIAESCAQNPELMSEMSKDMLFNNGLTTSFDNYLENSIEIFSTNNFGELLNEYPFGLHSIPIFNFDSSFYTNNLLHNYAEQENQDLFIDAGRIAVRSFSTFFDAADFALESLYKNNIYEAIRFHKRSDGSIVQLNDETTGRFDSRIKLTYEPHHNGIKVNATVLHPDLAFTMQDYVWDADGAGLNSTKYGKSVSFVFPGTGNALLRVTLVPPISNPPLAVNTKHLYTDIAPVSYLQSIDVSVESVLGINTKGAEQAIETKIIVGGSGFTVGELESVTVNFGDGAIETSKQENGHVARTLFYHDYVEPGDYRVTASLSLTNGGVSTSSQTITVSENGSVGGGGGSSGNYAPNGERREPDYSTTQVVGTTTRFKVKGTDVDCDLSHVFWSSTATVDFQESDNRDDFDDGCSDSESINILFNQHNNGGDHFDIIADLYDEQGNTERIIWKVRTELQYSPQLTRVSPVDQNINLPLGEHEFRLSAFDQDDNLDYVEWYLDGTLFHTDNTSDGNPANEEHEDVTFTERALHTIKAIATDNDGNESEELIWHIEAGFPADGNIAPTFSYFDLHPNELPFHWFRAGRIYEFEYVVRDIDQGILQCEASLNGNVIHFRDWNVQVPDTDYDGSFSVDFPNAGDHALTVTCFDSAGDSTDETIIITTLDADISQGSPPVIEHVYPSPGTVYNSGSFQINGVVFDPDFDAKYVLYYLNGNLVETDEIHRSGIFDESLHSDHIPSTGNHQLSIRIKDSAGNLTGPVNWTVRQNQSGNRAPEIVKTLPVNDDIIYVKAGDRLDNIWALVSDQDGDLDYIEWDYSGVGDPDPVDTRFVSYYVDSEDSTRADPQYSGQITAKVFDNNGNSSSTISFDLQVTQDYGNNAPQIVNDNFPVDGSTVIRMWDSGQNSVQLFGNVWDKDGDLVSVELKVNNEIRFYENIDYNHSFDDKSFLAGLNDIKIVALSNRAEPYEFEFIATDSRGNTAVRSWTMIRGPIEWQNHAPLVDSVIDLNMNQRDSIEFNIDVRDEEGDIPNFQVQNLDDDDLLEHLGDYNYRYTPTSEYFGLRSFQIEFDDSFGGISSTIVNINIQQVILPPVIQQNSHSIGLFENQSFEIGEFVNSIASSEWYDNNQLQYIWTDISGVDLSSNSGFITDNHLLSLIQGHSSGFVKGYIFDPEGRQSDELTLYVGKQVKISVEVFGNGAGLIQPVLGLSENCSGFCEYIVFDLTEIEFEAVPDEGFDFLGWSLPCDNSSTCSFTATENILIFAEFSNPDVIFESGFE